MPGEAFLRLTKPWPAMRVANAVGLGRLVALHSAQGILASGAAGLVVVDGLEPGDFLRGGQALQRVLADIGASWPADAAHDRAHPLPAALDVGRADQFFRTAPKIAGAGLAGFDGSVRERGLRKPRSGHALSHRLRPGNPAPHPSAGDERLCDRMTGRGLQAKASA